MRIDFDSGAVGPLRLGDSPEKAEVLGTPRRSGGKGANRTLRFADCELDFIDCKLACVKFDLDDATRVEVGDITLSRATKPLDAQVWFGDPASDSHGPNGLRWIDFERGGVTLALEFDSKGLNCVQMYSEGYA